MTMRSGTRVSVVPAVAVLLLGTAASAAAQACLGYPQGSNGAVAAVFSFPEDATGYDLHGMVASQEGGTFFTGGFGIVAPDDEGFENIKGLQGSVAYQVQALAPEASLCPLVGVGFSWVSDLNVWSIPFGVAVGSTFPLGPEGGAGFTPFAAPQFIYVRSSIDDVDDSAESDVHVALQAGATLNVGAFIVRGMAGKVFEEELDAVFSLSVGAAWR